MKTKNLFQITAVLLLLVQGCFPALGPDQVATSVAATLTALSFNNVPTESAEPSKGVPITSEPSTSALIPGSPYSDAPLCPDSGEMHDNNLFHTLWDDNRGCHYDHEHGQNPFTADVRAAFLGFDLRSLIGGVGVGHTNPSSPMENTHKHGGFKWNVQLAHPENCTGFEGAATGVNGSVIQFHGFGDYAIEAEVRIHSTVALLRQCKTSNPTDYGYIFVNQLQDYGQRVTPYQGTILSYSNQPVPGFPSPRGPYLSFDCIDLTSPQVPQCRISFEQALSSNANSNWTSKPTGNGHSDSSPLFRLLWRVRDTYRLFDWDDQTYPFKFQWLCSSDNGLTYDPTDCEHNNTTTQVHEIAGEIPAAWDNLAGFDINPAIGRVTAEGYVNQSGELNPACTAPATETDCFPIKLVDAFVGTWGSVLVYSNEGKGTNSVPSMPSRNIYFCGTQVCAESDPGAVPSGWLGQSN